MSSPRSAAMCFAVSTQEELHLRSLTFDYLYRWALFNRDWATRAEAELRRWRDTEPNAAKRRRALERIKDALAA